MQLVALVVLIMMYNEQKMAIPVMLVGLASLFYVLLSPGKQVLQENKVAIFCSRSLSACLSISCSLC